jgi:polar amino acid transport system permease protein
MSVIFENWSFIAEGIKTTVIVSSLATVGGITCGLIGAAGRLGGGRVINATVKLYIDVFRSTPLLIQLFWIYFALPIFVGKSIPPFTATIISLSLYEGAFFTEIFRAGILSLAKGQREAGLALGMRRLAVYRRIILPQAIVRMIPVIGSQFVQTVKNSALVSVIGVSDLTRQMQSIASNTLKPVPAFTAAIILYVLLTYPITVASNLVYRWQRIR